jgi:tRNA A22 N-methylase
MGQLQFGWHHPVSNVGMGLNMIRGFIEEKKMCIPTVEKFVLHVDDCQEGQQLVICTNGS